MATPRETAFDKELVPAAAKVNRYLDLPVSKVADRVWEATVLRGGQKISVKQELADCKSLAQKNQAALAALTSLVGQLVKGQAIDYARIKQDTVDALEETTVNVDINVNGKEA